MRQAEHLEKQDVTQLNKHKQSKNITSRTKGNQVLEENRSRKRKPVPIKVAFSFQHTMTEEERGQKSTKY